MSGEKNRKNGGDELIHNYLGKSAKVSDVEIFYKPGDTIIKEGDPGSDAYYIIDGRVEVYKRSLTGDITLAKLEKGSIFGEMSLIDKMPRSASIKAATEVRLLKINPEYFTTEINKSSPVFQELMTAFINRLRKADHNMIILSVEGQKQRKIAELTREEANIISHIARTGIELQNIFSWKSSYEWIINSLKDIGFSGFKLTMNIEGLRENYTVEKIERIKNVLKYEICFLGRENSGKLELLTPEAQLEERYEKILIIYAGLLSSCLFKSEVYSAFSSIAKHIESHIAETRVQAISKNLKDAIEDFSNKTLDIFMEIPERIKAGEKLEDILFDLTMGFQEIDRLVQEVDVLIKVISNVLGIAKGKLPSEISDIDKFIDEKGDQSLADEIFK